MHIVIGHTWKGETFVIGYTSSATKARKFVESFPDDGDNEFRWVEAQTARAL